MKIFLPYAMLFVAATTLLSGGESIAATDLRVRDPFILPDPATKTYYLYRQIANGRRDTTEGVRGVEVFQSKDLRTWTGPQTVFAQPPGFWADAEVWAPEVHKYQEKYHLFVTFTANRPLPGDSAAGAPPMRPRGTQILVADQPTGPFRPFANQAHTPAGWMSLDGTLWIEDGVPWMIFCHEWHQITDGTMDLVQLKPDLSAPVGEPRVLFPATAAPWVKSMKESIGGHHGYVTDGPFLFRTKIGKLLMIWSSFGTQRYAIGIAESVSGKVTGPWVQHPEPLFKADGGHGMIFTTFEGQLTLCFHQPNTRPDERMRFYPLEDTGDTLRLLNQQ
ncbi:glycoside hydrolase family 43 protein [Oleiharenicola lentus]|uniref:glycoside hydrolase family 43 protein n=1 Tax=Oleiharenicola lentus TaxID=2508720 RepID=UPI001C5547CE|nr:glycoside hydrolase family 43 protein [Oleiharenicola lentus]